MNNDINFYLICKICGVYKLVTLQSLLTAITNKTTIYDTDVCEHNTISSYWETQSNLGLFSARNGFYEYRTEHTDKYGKWSVKTLPENERTDKFEKEKMIDNL